MGKTLLIKKNCIRDWDNLKKNISDLYIPNFSPKDKKLSYTLVDTELYHHYLSSVIHCNQHLTPQTQL